MLATGGGDGSVRLWGLSSEAGATAIDVVAAGELRGCHSGAAVVGLAFSPDGKQLASCGWDRCCKVWDWV